VKFGFVIEMTGLCHGRNTFGRLGRPLAVPELENVTFVLLTGSPLERSGRCDGSTLFSTSDGFHTISYCHRIDGYLIVGIGSLLRSGFGNA
jgi:hypothetical protein